MGDHKITNALRIIRSVISNLIGSSRRSVDVIRANLIRNYQQGDGVEAAKNIQNLTVIYLKELGYSKMANELDILEQNTHALAKRDLNSEIQQAIDKLNAVSHIDKSGLISQALSKFPPAKHKHIEISHELHALFGAGRATKEEISQHLPQLSETLQIPLDFLEAASGCKATAAPASIPGPAPELIPPPPPPQNWPGYGEPPAPFSPDLYPPHMAPGYGAPEPNPYANVPGFQPPPPAPGPLPRY